MISPLPRLAQALAVLALTGAGAGCLSFHQGPMSGEPPTAAFASIDGVRIRYVDEGTGPAVVLLHGFASSLETWDLVRPLLRRNHRVIALDLKGFGWTDRPDGDYSPMAQARLVSRLLTARGVGDVSIVAHSWGSSVALAMALAEPERVRSLALYDAWVYDEQLPAFFRWARTPWVGEALFAAFYKQRPDERLTMAFRDPRMVTQQLADDVDVALDRPGTLAAALAAVRGQDFLAFERRYRTIRKPVLLLWGQDDRVALPEHAGRLLSELPDVRAIFYPNCGHFPMLEVAEASNAALVAFLAGGAQ